MKNPHHERFKAARRLAKEEIAKSGLRYYVYGHYMDGVLKYIGRGSGSRALFLGERNPAWEAAITDCKAFEIAILSRHEAYSDAKDWENIMINMHRPPCNRVVSGYFWVFDKSKIPPHALSGAMA
jgi:hypothetical protein